MKRKPDRPAARRSLVERGKNLLIVLLVLSALFLVYEGGYYSTAAARLTASSASSDEGTEDAGPTTSAAAARPLCIMISGSEGLRYGAAFDSDAVASVFDNFSAALGEALGSAGEPQEISESDFREGLTGQSLTLDYYYPQQLSLLSLWLGTDAGGASGCEARLLSVSCSGENAALLFADWETGSFYSCETGVSSQTFVSRMEAYRQTNACFAFESERYDDISPYTFILYSLPKVNTVTVSGLDGMDFDYDSLFTALDINSYVMRQYEEVDGTQVYVEGGRTLRVRADGTISFKRSATDSDAGEETTAAEQISIAYRLVSGVLSSDVQELRFAGLEDGEDGSVTALFAYCINGVPVELGEDIYAARVTLEGGEVMQLDMQPRSYTLSGTAGVLPMEQACAIISSQGGGEPRLVYLDSGLEAECKWVTG